MDIRKDSYLLRLAEGNEVRVIRLAVAEVEVEEVEGTLEGLRGETGVWVLDVLSLVKDKQSAVDK